MSVSSGVPRRMSGRYAWRRTRLSRNPLTMRSPFATTMNGNGKIPRRDSVIATPYASQPPACSSQNDGSARWRSPSSRRWSLGSPVTTSVRRVPRQQRLERRRLGSLLRAQRERLLARRVHRHARVLPFLVEDEEADVEVREAARVEQARLDGVRANALERFHPGILRVHAASHALDDEVRRAVVEIRLAATRRAGGADVVVHVEAGAEDGRVADASRDLPRETAGRRHAADVAVGVDAVAVDGAPERAFGNEAVLHHRPSRVERATAEITTRQRGQLALARILLVLVLLADPALRRVEPVLGVQATAPLEPERARALGVEVGLDREAEGSGEVLGALPGEQVMVGLVHHGLRHERRRAHAL